MEYDRLFMLETLLTVNSWLTRTVFTFSRSILTSIHLITIFFLNFERIIRCIFCCSLESGSCARRQNLIRRLENNDHEKAFLYLIPIKRVLDRSWDLFGLFDFIFDFAVFYIVCFVWWQMYRNILEIEVFIYPK